MMADKSGAAATRTEECPSIGAVSIGAQRAELIMSAGGIAVSPVLSCIGFGARGDKSRPISFPRVEQYRIHKPVSHTPTQ